MKKIVCTLATLMMIFCINVNAQVSTNFNNTNSLAGKGQFKKDYSSSVDYVIQPKNIDSLLLVEKKELMVSNETKPFRLATALAVNLDLANLIKWTIDEDYAYGRFTIKLSGALSSSISFDNFYLPKNTELFVYNENGNMITGPVTEKENNDSKIWGSWVYRGEFITIEIKTPVSTKDELKLHANNIAYGYKEIYKSVKVGGYGLSGPCNINVICPLGNGWEGERNSVSTILSASGSELCTGSLVMNTCNSNQPYYLTANHCFNADQNTAGWRFAFQAWSTTCPNPGVNTNGVIYNGATLRARNAATDFCLVELNTTPPANSGLSYSGWSRSTTPAQNATAIHHPSGDLMKISRANNPVSVGSFAGTTNQHWRADWSPQNNGAGQTVTAITEPGSSGSPLFDQNHRIIGQLHGGPSACTATQLWDFYGRFDLSWTGGGTNATRLSNWLDPTNSSATTTNTTPIQNLITLSQPVSLSITGPQQLCTNSTNTHSLAQTPPAGTIVNWTVYPNDGSVLITPSSSGYSVDVDITNALVNSYYNLTATVPNTCPVSSASIQLYIPGSSWTGAITGFQGWSSAMYTGPLVEGDNYLYLGNGATWFEAQLTTSHYSINWSNVWWEYVAGDYTPYANSAIYRIGYDLSAFGGSNGYVDSYYNFHYTDDCGSHSVPFHFMHSNSSPPSYRTQNTKESYLLKLSPNPAADYINLSVIELNKSLNTSSKLFDYNSQKTIRIYDRLGNLIVQRTQIISKVGLRLNISMLKPNELYNVIVEDRNGFRLTSRFIKQ